MLSRPNEELQEAWNRIRRHETPGKIDPLP